MALIRTDTKLVTIRTTLEQADALVEYARAEDRSVASLIREWIERRTGVAADIHDREFGGGRKREDR
jgi:hypothetical protein